MNFAPPLFTTSFLHSVFASEIEEFSASGEDARLRERLIAWASRDFQKETTAEAEFIDVFFRQTWGYWGAGGRAKEEGYTLYPQYPVEGAGQAGGTGFADSALGFFGHDDIPATPQVLCEWKDVRSGLDAPQRRKDNDRSPVRQCADYLKEASRKLYGNEPIQPSWGLVSDMNEFRLYSRRTMPAQYQRFFVRAPEGQSEFVSLVDDSHAARLQRFFFYKLLSFDMLLSSFGPSKLEKLLESQGAHERALEKSFYSEYRDYRESVYQAIVECNPGFQGTRGKLVRLTQRFLDRAIFILYCEDMGKALNFPPNVLRDLLNRESLDPLYDPNDTSVWHKIKRLFTAMRDGTPFGESRINRFNGGLFEPEPELEALDIPNYVFCQKGQGASPEAVAKYPKTLLFFSATYDFGVRSGAEERGIGLYTLGRIFEQSITDLEQMEAHADNRPSITELSKRKRDGVYYTPEWVTHYIVDETIGTHLREARRRLDLDDGSTFTEDELERYQMSISGKRRFKAPEAVVSYLERLETYAKELADIKVLDPACGSGAFLIQALEKLVEERRWVAEERERITGQRDLFDIDKMTKAVMTENLYGVDINSESVEITRLALWLHSALPDRPLCALDENIVCGNSLVGPEFYAWRQQGLFSEEEKERINVFDYRAAFPDVFNRNDGRGGFDCVIGNPPYVKLQNFRKVDPDVAEYLVQAKRPDGSPLYASTQTQNFDLYLPFLERGMELLNEGGRMGYIAPSVWLVNEYGKGLRRRLYETRRLERWIDFKDYQVFDEAITYTALQFYRGRAGHGISCIFAPDGKLAGTSFAKADALVPYAELEEEGTWIFAPAVERRLLKKLEDSCTKLGDDHAIFVGVQTSADHIYHLTRVGPGRYLQRGRRGAEAVEVEIEDNLMRPLVSGEEAKRYQSPLTDTYLLFPYDDSDGDSRLLTATELADLYPHGWAYLQEHEAVLRARERQAFDDDKWYRFGRNQNIDKQRLMKLGVAQTVPSMRVFFDHEGGFCLNNVRVNGILVNTEESGWFLLGVLNGPVADFVFRRIAKPKEGGYFEANKQFIAPLPIPKATEAERIEIGERAKELQRLHTERRDLMLDLDRRLQSSHMSPAGYDESWLFGDVGNMAAWREKAPLELRGRARTAWARREREARLSERLEPIARRLRAGAELAVVERRGELGLMIDGISVLDSVFVDTEEAPFIAAQWRQMARQTNITAAFDASRLVRLLLAIEKTEHQALRAQVIELDMNIRKLDAEIDAREHEMNELLYGLYDLTAEERELVESEYRRG